MKSVVAATIVVVAVCSAPAAARQIDVTVTVDPSFDRARVRLDSTEALYRLEARGDTAARELEAVADCDGAPLALSRRIDAGGRRCIRYDVGLVNGARLAASPRREVVVTAARDWLWLPPRRGRPDVVRVRFELPDGARVSAPWRPGHGVGEFEIEPRPSSGRSYVVIGRFREASVESGGATLRLTDLASRNGAEHERLKRWIESAAANVATLYGRFPNPSPQVLLLPASGRSDSPVPFGMVSRRGGESVLFYVDPRRPLRDFETDWTATHEFSHLLLPYVREKWISEGFATYLQNLLLARGGGYSQSSAWQRLSAGFGRGEASAPELSPRAASRGGGYGTTMKVYWSGAWLALAADVELRRRSNGEHSLASALDAFGACCLPADRSFGGRELMRELDRLSGGHGVFGELYAQSADVSGFPDYEELLLRLGVVVDGRDVRFDDTAPLASIRAGLMRRHRLSN